MTELEFVHKNPLTPAGGVAWQWEISVYLFLGGVTAGIMVIAALLARRVPPEERSRWVRYAPLMAPLLLSVGMLMLWLDLERKLTAYRFYLALEPTSPMSWGSWILLAIYPATLLFGLGLLTDEETDRLCGFGPVRPLSGLVRRARAFAAAHMPALGRTNLVLGVALGTYTGILLGSLGARAAWNTTILGPLFLVSGLSTGAALLMLFPLSKGEHHMVRNWDVVAIVVELALLGLYIVGLVTGGADARVAGALILGGELTALFWSLVVLAGLCVPLLVEGLEWRRGLRPTRVAPALILIGGLSLRFILVTAGQTVTPLTG